MSRLDQHVAAVQNRLAMDRFLRALAWTGLIGVIVLLMMILLDRAVQWHPPRSSVWLEAGLVAAVLAAAIYAVRRRPSAHQAAVAIDTKLGLNEKICTALYARSSTDPFAMAAVKDAEATAQNVVLHGRQHFPLQFPKAAYGTIVVAIAALAATQLPSMDLLGHQEAKKKILVQQQKADFAKKQLQDALAVVDAVPQAIASDETIKLAKQDLTTSLKNGVDDPAKASRTALKALQDVDAAVKQQIKTNVQFAQAKADEKMWKQIGDQPITDPGPVNEARKDLTDGKFTQAINDLSNVVNNFDKMDKKEQEKAAEQMKQMAQQLAQQANNPPQQQQQQQQQMQQMGMNQQMAQQAQQLMQQAANGNQQAQQQLQQMAQQAMKQMNNGQGPNPQQQQQVQQMMQQMQAAANNQAQAQQLAQAAQQMAQAMQQQAQQGQQAGQPAQKGQQGAQQANKGQQAQQQANGQQGKGQGNQQKQGGQQQAQGNQPGGQQAQAQAQQMGQGMQQMQQQLQQMQAVAADAQQIAAAQQAAQNGAQQAMNGANAGQAGNGGQPGGNGQWPGNNGGQVGGPPPNGQWQGGANNGLAPNNGGQGAGDRSGKAYAPYTVKAEVSPSQDIETGRLLASTFVKAGTVKGESKEQLKEVAASAMKDATDEIDQQRVSRQAQKVVREYFSSMQKDTDGAPAADDSHK